MNNEDSRGARKGEPGPPVMIIMGGSRTNGYFYGKRKKFEQCFERCSECVY